MKKPSKSSIFRFTYIGITILVIVLIGVFDSNFKNIGEALKNLNVFWILGAGVCMLLYWLSDAWLLKNITNYMSESKLTFGKSLKIGIIGLYYCAITPSSSGGQPFQVLYMSRENIPVGTSTCIVVLKFIAYSLTAIAYYILASIFMGSFYHQNYPAVFWFSFLGFLLFALAITLFVFTMVKQTLVLRAGHALINFLHKIKLIKKAEKANASFEKTIKDYTETAEYIKTKKRYMVGSFFISFINIGLLFAVTYFVYRAFGLSDYSFIYIMALQTLLYMAVSYFPLPGAAGASEGGFYIIFSAFFSKNLVFLAMLIWRIFTYYSVLIVGSLVVVLDELFTIRKKKKEQPPDKISE